MEKNALTFQEIILRLQQYWGKQGCVIMQPYDSEVGAGTFHTATLLRSLGKDSWRACYAQPCRRPADGRYGENPNRMQHYYQFQVLIKPSPVNSQVNPVPVEITYGLERIAMYVQGVNSVYDIVWSYLPDGTPMTYGNVFLENEREFSAYNFEVANIDMMRQKFDDYEAECHSCLDRKLPLPAYDCVMKCSHAFNILDARGALSAVERANYILRVRAVAKACCESYLAEVAGGSADNASSQKEA